LIKLADEGLGQTYLHTLDLKESDKLKLRHFKEPKPASEFNIPQSELKSRSLTRLEAL
jgi:LysR family hydrogen peroxide-inducible transcriptional activator